MWGVGLGVKLCMPPLLCDGNRLLGICMVLSTENWRFCDENGGCSSSAGFRHAAKKEVDARLGEDFLGGASSCLDRAGDCGA